MIHTDRAIVVEGKYDKIKLGGLIDGVILCTGGFRIYKDKEMQQMLRALAKKQGLAVLTDSDAAGFQIRSLLRSKQHPSREGKLGVEGIPEAVLLKALEDAGVGVKAALKRADPITKLDLFELGLSGGAQSAVRRAKLMKRLELPEHLSANALVTVLASLYSREELYRLCASLFGEGEQ